MTPSHFHSIPPSRSHEKERGREGGEKKPLSEKNRLSLTLQQPLRSAHAPLLSNTVIEPVILVDSMSTMFSRKLGKG